MAGAVKKRERFLHLLGIEDLSVDLIRAILERSRGYKKKLSGGERKFRELDGRSVVNLFYEPSTRTRSSFELAAKKLSADIINFSADSGTSVVKGETLLDTAKTLEAMNPDLLILRHESSGAPQLLAERLRIPVVNAGDGFHEHPTQALLDALTIEENCGAFKGLRVSIIGDIAHSRVARSNIHLLTKLGAKVKVCGPPTLIPPFVEKLRVEFSFRLEDALKGADVVMMLRIQHERQNGKQIPSNAEYYRFYGLNSSSAKSLKQDAIVMHPGPMNRGVEISPDVADGKRSVILHQVTNGVAVRMAVLAMLQEERERGR